jgi:hypothetical protein
VSSQGKNVSTRACEIINNDNDPAMAIFHCCEFNNIDARGVAVRVVPTCIYIKVHNALRRSYIGH